MTTQAMINAAIDTTDAERDAREDVRAARSLAAALTAFADELEGWARSTLEAGKRGAKGKAAIYTEGAALLRGRAAELETYGPISAAEQSRRDALAKTEADAERLRASADDFTPGGPKASDYENTALKVEQSAESLICGIEDGDLGYVCNREPHEPGDGSHEVLRPDGTPSVRWPDTRPTARAVDTPDDVKAIKEYLLGVRDELPDLIPAESEASVVNPTPDPFAVPAAVQELADDPFATAAPSSDRPPWRLDPDPAPFHLDPAVALPAPDHVSYSQITTAEACGLQLRLKKRDGRKGQPGYATVGGTTFHACVELIERRRLGLVGHGTVDAAMAGDLAACAELFGTQFGIAMAEAEFASGVPRERWRVAAQGAEGETWWRHNGALMVRDYVAWSEARHADGWAILRLSDMLGIELDLNTPIAHDIETSKAVNLNSRIDLVWYQWQTAASTDPDPTPVLHVHIEDGKSGAKLTADTFQLGVYGHAVARELARAFPPSVIARMKLTASYYDARNGKSSEPIDPLAAHSWGEIEYRALTTLGMHSAMVYPANPNAAYGGPCGMCDVRHACPIMATRE